MQNPIKFKSVLCGAALLAMLPLGGIFTSVQADSERPVFSTVDYNEAPAGGFVLIDDDDDDDDDRPRVRGNGRGNRGNGRGNGGPIYDVPRGNRNNGNGNGRNNQNGADVLRGVVLNRSNDNSFEVRATDGRTYTVVTDNNILVQRGAQVRIRGEVSGNTFRARAVTILDRDEAGNGYIPGNDGDFDYGNNNGNNDYTGTVNFVATVTRVIDRNEYRVRANDGRTFEVRTNSRLSNIQVGDQVRVSGERDGDRIRRANLNEVGFNNGNGNDYDYGNGGAIGSRINFEARIISIGQAGRNAQVRGANGQTYRLRTSNNELSGLSVGDRIRVRGTYSNGVIQVTNISRR